MIERSQLLTCAQRTRENNQSINERKSAIDEQKTTTTTASASTRRQ